MADLSVKLSSVEWTKGRDLAVVPSREAPGHVVVSLLTALGVVSFRLSPAEVRQIASTKATGQAQKRSGRPTKVSRFAD